MNLTVNAHLPLSPILASNRHQRLLEVEKLPISEVDSHPKTATRSLYQQINAELRNHLFHFLDLSPNDMSLSNSYIHSFSVSI